MDSNVRPHPSNDGAANYEAKVQDIVLSILPRGYKFCPNDVELINYYLKRKIAGDPIIPGRFRDVDVYNHSPEELVKYKYKGENDTYFFAPKSKKYANEKGPDRSAENSGFWKAIGKEDPISNNNIKIGSKRTLVFYKGKSTDAVKTNWIMQEFTINDLTSCSSATLCNTCLDEMLQVSFSLTSCLGFQFNPKNTAALKFLKKSFVIVGHEEIWAKLDPKGNLKSLIG